MGVRSQRPRPPPPPCSHSSWCALDLKLCRGPASARGPGAGGKGPPIKKSLPTLAHPEQPPSASAVPEPLLPGRALKDRQDQGGGPSSSLGLVGPSGVKVIPTPTPDSSGPLPAPALRLATDTPGSPREMVLWPPRHSRSPVCTMSPDPPSACPPAPCARPVWHKRSWSCAPAAPLLPSLPSRPDLGA